MGLAEGEIIHLNWVFANGSGSAFLPAPANESWREYSMTPPEPRTINYDNLAAGRNPTPNLQTSEDAEASRTMVTQNTNWKLPQPDWGTVKGFRS
jgi:hypothetical protein